MVQKYEDLVSELYKKIVADEGIDVNSQYATQEANRRARDSVRGQLLSTAPMDIREEVEGEVHIGGSSVQPNDVEGVNSVKEGDNGKDEL